MNRVYPEDFMNHSADTADSCARSGLKRDPHALADAVPGDAGSAAVTTVTSLPYEPPQVVVIGTIRDLTSGSSSSGRTDANSQYYW